MFVGINFVIDYKQLCKLLNRVLYVLTVFMFNEFVNFNIQNRFICKFMTNICNFIISTFIIYCILSIIFIIDKILT